MESKETDKAKNEDTSTITLSMQYEMKNKMEKLSQIHCLELFEIIKKNTTKYTINKNGVFMNLKNFSNDTLHKIYMFLSYIDSVNETLNEERF